MSEDDRRAVERYAAALAAEEFDLEGSLEWRAWLVDAVIQWRPARGKADGRPGR